MRPVGPYSFEASVRFLEGFAPPAYEGNEAGHLHLASSPTVARTWRGYACGRREV